MPTFAALPAHASLDLTTPISDAIERRHREQGGLTIVKPIKAPPAAGIFLGFLCLLVENVPYLASFIAKDAGFFRMRELPFLSQERISAWPLPPEGWVRALKEEGKSLTIKDICDAEGVSADAALVTAKAFHEAYLAKKTDPVKVATALLERIKATHSPVPFPNPEASSPPPLSSLLNHFIQVDPSRVLAQAEASRLRYEQGRPLSPLDGVPVAVKDEVDVEGYGTWAGTAIVDRTAKKEDAVAVARLRALGAVVVGKTAMEELGWSVFSTNTHGPVPRNPHNTLRSCGGSSGGSGGAVAAGFVPISIGCDGGGSVRIPASFNGVFGLKPTHARISGRGGFTLAESVGVQGPLAASADDLAIAYLAMAGPDEKNPQTKLQPPVYLPPSYLKPSVKGLRVGVLSHYNAQVGNPAITASLELIKRKLVEGGAELVEVEIPLLDDIRMAHAITISSEINSNINDRPRLYKLTWANRIMLHMTNLFKARDYVRANQLRTHLIRMLVRIFSPAHDNVQILLTPSTAMTSPPLPSPGVLARGGASDGPNLGETMRYVFVSNFGGIPAVSVPVGVDADGMPVGVQFMAEWWGESALLEMAKWSEGVLKEEAQGVRRGKAWVGDLI
ncbi:hypothetical protein HDU96_000837 [Phlyctochytrium bullatum]|nr:hypothetical protein HDU96_000837 [Phlyctochytrium bullatum]